MQPYLNPLDIHSTAPPVVVPSSHPVRTSCCPCGGGTAFAQLLSHVDMQSLHSHQGEHTSLQTCMVVLKRFIIVTNYGMKEEKAPILACLALFRVFNRPDYGWFESQVCSTVEQPNWIRNCRPHSQIESQMRFLTTSGMEQMFGRGLVLKHSVKHQCHGNDHNTITFEVSLRTWDPSVSRREVDAVCSCAGQGRLNVSQTIPVASLGSTPVFYIPDSETPWKTLIWI